MPCTSRKCGCAFQIDDAGSAPGITMVASGTGEVTDPYVITITTNLAELISDNLDGVTLEVAAGNAQVKDGGIGAAKIKAEAWAAFNCDWASTAIQPTIGNGVLEARQITFGKTCHWTISLRPGSTTNAWTGNVSFRLPHAPYGSDALIIKAFKGILMDEVTQIPYPVVLLVRENYDWGYLFWDNGTGALVDKNGVTGPVAITTTTSISLSGTFETE